MRKAITSVWPCGLAPGALSLAAGLAASAMAAGAALAPGRIDPAPAREPLAKAAAARHAACVAGLRVTLAALPPPLPSAERMLAELRSSGSALLDVCGGEPMIEAVAAERGTRWLEACRLHRPEGVTCERLHRELLLYRMGD